MFKRILVAVDGSEASNKALLTALQLARGHDSLVRLVFALDELASVQGYRASPQRRELAHEDGENVLRDALAITRASGTHADTYLAEARGRGLGEVIADAVHAWHADVVVVGTHGRRGIGRLLLGSGAEEVLRTSTVPVLSIRSETLSRAER